MRVEPRPDGGEIVSVGEHVPAVVLWFPYEGEPCTVFTCPPALQDRYMEWLRATYPHAYELLAELCADTQEGAEDFPPLPI